MQAKHTPGPWIADKAFSGTQCVICANAPDGQSFNLAFLPGQYNERSANARLIADAPYLLTALKELELRTRQFIAGELVSFPAALLPQVQALIEHVEGGAA